MPKIYINDTRLQTATLIKELPNTSMLLGGQLVDKQTLQPKFPGQGDENNAVVRDWSNNGGSGQNVSPFQMYVAKTNWNSPILSCFYYLSGYFKAQSVAADTVNNRTYHVVHGQAGAQSANGSTIVSVTAYQNSCGQFGGWGLIRDFNKAATYVTGSYAYLSNVPDSVVMAYDANTEAFLFANRYPNTIAQSGGAQSQYLTPPYNSTAAIVGIIRIDSAGNRYYWRCKTNTIDGALNNNTVAPYFSNHFVPSGALEFTYNAVMTESNNTNSNALGSLYGPATVTYKQFILATATYVYYHEYTTGAAAIGASTTSVVILFKKMTYTGTETTIGTYGAWMYGVKLPTPVFNETATAASFIYHVWNQWTGTAGAVVLYRCDVNKTLGTETITTITQDAATVTAFTRMYSLFGIQTTSTPLGVYNSPTWRSQAITRTWLVTGATGTLYMMMSFEHPQTSFAPSVLTTTSYSNNAMNSVSIQGTYFNTTTHTNDNASGFLRRDAFRIWSWTIDATYSSLTYRAETDFTALMPRWIMPVDNGNGLIQYMAQASDTVYDRVIQFDEVSYKWAVTNTMPYRCDHIGQDSLGRLWISTTQAGVVATDTLFLEGLYIPQTVTITPYQTAYVYTGTPIASNISITTPNFAGNLIAANVGVALSGSTTFQDGSTYRVITTSSSAPVVANIIITGSTTTRFSGNIVNLI
jgi:hypothetical protein